MDKLTEIGYISACVARDSRYTSKLRVYIEGDKAHIVLSENGAAGGMDGSGGTMPFRETNRMTVLATPSIILKAIKMVMDTTIKRYGTPTKRFTWIGVPERGLSKALCKRALNVVESL